jgi:hypothetical protein
MLRDGDENQVAASHKYLTAGSKKIFPEDVHLADGSDSSRKAVALARIARDHQV